MSTAIPEGFSRHTSKEAARTDAEAAAFEYDNARTWFESVMPDFDEPLAVEVWIFDPNRQRVLLVNHRWRGWVPPGGAVEPGETPRDAAVREALEEVGLTVELAPEPAAVAVRSFRHDWAPTLALSYTAVAPPSAIPQGEAGQEPAWFDLATKWSSVFNDDRQRMLNFLAHSGHS
jgi:8-oxo-dGTP diphosphatase